MTKAILLWILAIVLTISAAVYQKATGPTYPKKGKVTIGKEEIKYKLIRTDEVTGQTEKSQIVITVPNNEVTGTYIYKRYKSYDTWTTADLIRKGDSLIAEVPRQPMAGKVEYQITLSHNGQNYLLTKEPVIMRFKGVVPRWPVLYPHIFFMFFAMLFSTRAGISAIFKEKSLKLYVTITLISLFIGGLILGPIMQKYAFDHYWTGWPFGHDLTDNKTIVAFISWVLAFYFIQKNHSKKRTWAIVASVALMAVYMIPHSALGSEIDHTKTEVPVNNQDTVH